MTKRSLHILLAACAWAAPLPAYAEGPIPPGGTVSGNGTVDVKRQPETLRIQVEVLAKGKDLKEALAKLKERQEAARTQLAALGAAKDSVEFGEPALTSEKNDRQRQLERMVAERVRGGGKAAKTKQAAPVVVATSLRAELPLKAAGAEELLFVFTNLQEKIKTADLGGLKEMEKLSPQEEEVAEENQANALRGGEDEPRRGEPVYLFVCKISDEDRAKALADAFQKARREADRLARAAAAELGALHHLDSQNQGGGDDNPYVSNGRFYRQQSRVSQLGDPDEQAREAVGTQPGKVTLRVTVSAAFTLKPSAGK